MAWLLSVKTVFARRGGRVWYDDQREAHRQIYAGDDVVEYAFMGADPTAADNRWLREATMEQQVPVIYFLGVSPGRYQPIIPTFVVGWYPDRLRVELTFGAICWCIGTGACPGHARTPLRASGNQATAAPSGFPRGRADRVWWPVCHFAATRAEASRCRS